MLRTCSERPVGGSLCGQDRTPRATAPELGPGPGEVKTDSAVSVLCVFNSRSTPAESTARRLRAGIISFAVPERVVGPSEARGRGCWPPLLVRKPLLCRCRTRSTMGAVTAAGARARIGPVVYRARLDLRARWRTLVLLALLIGLVGGGLLAAGAAARRTDSAFDRLRRETRGADAYLAVGCAGQACSPGDGDSEAHALEALPGVESAVPLRIYGGRFETADGRVLQESVGDEFEISVIAGADPRFGTDVDRLIVVGGRAAEPAQPFEVVVDKELSTALDVEPGDVLLLTVDVEHGDVPGPYDVALDVVGVVLAPIGVRTQSGSSYVSTIFAGPGLVAALGDNGDVAIALTLDPGANRTVVEGTVLAERVLDMDEKAVEIDAGTENDTIMLVVILTLGGVGSLLVLSPVIARAESSAQHDAALLRTLGLTRRDLIARGALHGLVLGAVSGAVAFATAVSLSPLAPIAEARRFEPDRGVDFDLAVLVPGTMLVVTLVTCGVVLSVWRATRPRRVSSPRSSALARLLGSRRVGPVGSLGLRMGFGGGDREATGVGYFASLVLGAAAVTAAVTFVDGLDRLQRTPRLVGMNFDLLMLYDDELGEDSGPWAAAQVAALLDQPEIDRSSAGTYFPPALFELGAKGTETWLVSFQGGPRAVEPVVVEGRAPAASHELLVHPDLLDDVGEIGDVVVVSATIGAGDLGVGSDVGSDEGGEDLPRVSADYTIVGTGVSPVGGAFKFTSAMTYDGLLRILGPDPAVEFGPQVVVAGVRDGVDVDDAIARLERAGVIDGRSIIFTTGSVGDENRGSGLNAARDIIRLDLDGADRVPRVLALLFGLLGTCVLALMIADKVRAWRRRLAIHRALGITTWQIRGGVVAAVVATSLAAVAAAVPLGLVAGRELWIRHAERLGVVPEAPVPWITLGVVAAGAVAVATVVALRPAWMASRPRVTLALRAE